MKRFKVLVAALLVFALSPIAGALAFANDGDAGEAGGASAASGAGTGDAAGVAVQAAGGQASVSDPSTIDNWKGLLQYDTSDVGRIWTDKTVLTESYGDGSEKVELGNSAFLTALSAISSTSNIASTATAPLDVVLVLDASGSMGDPMGRGPNQTTRIEALQEAANAFVDTIAEQNEGISDVALQHQVSIVKFAGNKTDKVGNDTYFSGSTYNYSQVMKAVSPCTDATKGEFQSQINAIEPAGATRADNGLALAENQTSGRNGENGGVAAKKIVVFFTDGTPTTMSSFDNGVASGAVTSVKVMKDAGASVYAIGIFDGVNPSADPKSRNASNENKFMQAVSSNYPDATFAQSDHGYVWNFGDRAEGSDFYKSATDADELANVFKEISKEIVAGAGYPTKTTEGAELDSGFITFDDPLGAYMKVDDVKAILMNGALFTGKSVSHEDNVTTYRFGGAETIEGEHVLLANIDITVTRSDDVATGDVVQVKVPARMIPLRNFNVNEDEMVMSVTDTDPLSVFYTSSLKDEAAGLLAKPDATMASYLQENMAGDGQATFLANRWSGELGNVTATFEPSPKNSYYYFTHDVPIFADQACTQRAHEVKTGETYWYQHEFYELQEDYSLSGRAELRSEPISFPGGAAEQFEGAIGYDANGAFFKAGTARLTYIDDLHMAKTNNVTQTAADVLNPKWNDTTLTSAATMVGSYLGNNGKLSVDVPGSLTVTKQIEVPEGYSLEDYADTEFEFALMVPDAAGKTLAAGVTDADGKVVAGGITSLTFDADGNATFKLKGGQSLHVYGLAGDSAYTVLEVADDALNGWQQIESSGQEGRIVAGQTSEVKFVNEYSATGHLGEEHEFVGAKVLTGRDWTESDRFVFQLKAASTSPDAPLPQLSVPEGVTPEAGSAYVEVTAEPGTPAGHSVALGFGDIEYTKPGTYTYEIWESEQASTILPGVSPSQALYQVVVTVVDEHNGTLSVATEWKKLFDDSGTPVAPGSQGETPGGAVFVNEYDTTTVKWSPSGTKFYTDKTGAFGFTRGMFNVALCTNDATAPLPPEGSAERITAMIDGMQWRGVIATVEEGGSISFPQMEYGYTEQGKRFEYKIVEVVKDTDGNWVAVKDMAQGANAIPGMTYDSAVWTVDATVTENSEGVLELEASYLKDGALTNGMMFSFRNTYNPTSAKATISGSKVLIGRDMLREESFGFLLEAANSAAQSVLPQAEQAEVRGLRAGVEGTFDFSELTFVKPGTYMFKLYENAYYSRLLPADGTAGITFVKPGTYMFKLYENAYYSRLLPADGTAGITFDRHKCTVKVVVADDHSGALKAEVSYEGAGPAEGNPEQFVNRFADTLRYGDAGGLEVVKTLNGRDMVAGEFSFTVEGMDEASAERLADADCSFTNHARAAGEEDVMHRLSGLTFGPEDAGKTFAFRVSEVVPADGQKLAGVTYADPATHEVRIAVGIDAETWHLQATTTVDGRQVNVATVGDDGKVSIAGETARVAFVNAYKAGDVSFDTATAGLRKVLEGRDWLDSDAFTFKIEALDGAPAPRDAAGNEVDTVTVNRENASGFSFGSMTFTSDMVAGEPGRTKMFAYRVTEVEPAAADKLPGIEYGTNVATIKVTVRDDGTGALKASSVTENGTFVNRYAAQIDYTAAGGLNVGKTLTGRDMTDGQFTIRVTPADELSARALGLPLEGRDVSMPAAADGQQVVKSVLGSDPVKFSQEDAGETYTYTVVELGEAPAGYTYDAAERTVAITVVDNPRAGALSVTTVVSGGPEGERTFTYPAAAGEGAAAVPFANSYRASTDNPGGAAASVTATKKLTGRSLAEGEFSFAVRHAAGGSDVLTATNTADGTVAFGTLSYDTDSLADLVKDGLATKSVVDGKTQWAVPYVAYEKTDGLAAEGVTAQTQPISFTVAVVDNGDGTMTATANTGRGLVFENAYATDEAVVNLAGVKQLQVEEGLQPADITGKFTFTVMSDDPAAPMPVSASTTNDAQGKVDFGAITFTLDDLNRALGTTSANAAGGVVAVANAKAGANADASDVAGKNAAVDAAGVGDTDERAADEAVDKAAGASAGEVASEVGVANGAGNGAVTVGEGPSAQAADLADAVAVGETAAQDSASAQSAIAVQAGAPRSHVFVYKVTESGMVSGVTNDAAAVKTVSIKVTDNGAGKLTAERIGDAADPAFAFTNMYSVEPKDCSVTDQITVTKVLTGRDLIAGEFAFELLEGDRVVATGVNNANGGVVLSAVTYTKPGTHQYMLREVGAGQVKAGVIFDGAVFAVKATVTDNGDGTLSVAHKLNDGGDVAAVKFANAYQPLATSVVLSASKTLAGKTLENGQFTFLLTAADGTVLQAKNAADGTVTFPAMRFDQPGTYEFTMSELNDAQANVTYDKRTYQVTVAVEDDLQGHLNATVTSDNDTLTFENTYVEPPVPEQPGAGEQTPPTGKVTVQTGDNKLLLAAPLAAVALAGAAAIAALVMMRLRNRH